MSGLSLITCLILRLDGGSQYPLTSRITPLFGNTAGFKTSEPNVTPDTTPSSVELEDDF